ncbi:MAG: methyltransferase [Microthrixaceae bacterium]
MARAVEHPRLRAVGGDAFESIPDGHDTYLLVNVLHDWGDDDCRRWFANLARAMGPDARLVVVEFERVDRPGPGMETRVDLLMAALTGGGKERSADEFAALAKPEGLALESTTPLVSGDLAHTFRRAV